MKRILALITVLSFTVTAHANKQYKKDKTIKDRTTYKTTIENETHRKVEEARKRISSEAVLVVNETRSALMALDRNHRNDALAALSRANANLSLLLAQESNLGLAPTQVRALVTKLSGNKDMIKEIREQSEDYLEVGQAQVSRNILKNFADELVIETTSIPLSTYPDAIKLSARLIDEGNVKEAKQLLQQTLDTLVVTEDVVPLPLLTAQILLRDAETYARKKGRSDKESKWMTDHLKNAKAALEMGELLGYGTRSSFKNLYTQIRDIESKTTRGKSGDYFGKLNASLSNMIDSSRNFAQKIEDEPKIR